MIISASRRTDIPACYSEWFYNRIQEGYVLVRNPMNIHRIGKIDLSPDVVDGIVFWTKNPSPMLNRLDELEKYTYYFQFTLNAYGKDVEPHVPSKHDIVIPCFQKLAEKIGKSRVIWRYDPILFNERYTMAYHLKYFRRLAAELADYTEKCTVSFLDFYKNTKRNTQSLRILTPTLSQKTELLRQFSEIAKEFGIYVDTCAEDIDLEKFGIHPARCVDADRLERIGGYGLAAAKDRNQRPACGCAASIDIGAYHTCQNGCRYCYATYDFDTARKNFAAHNPLSPLLSGNVGEEDEIAARKAESNRDGQLTFDIGQGQSVYANRKNDG